MSKNRIGVIGGSGLYDMEGLTVLEELAVETPFGPPSDTIALVEVAGREVAFLPRHGRGHRLLPSELPFRANIYAFKKIGVERIISVGAVGSMREDVHPREVVVPDQFIDRTRGRADTFFGGGVVAHVSFAEPVCAELSAILADTVEQCGGTVHRGGTYLCMEGPAFSTRAESQLYRSWSVDVIGMTNLQEAKLAREAEICYATMACVTDYDCWRESDESVTVEMLLENLRKNTELARKVICGAVPLIPHERACPCANALGSALLTDLDQIDDATRDRLDAIIGRYIR
ncbi:MAG: S-methyl-5'-thioadenosine phosphorylase [Planctomycetes bacterium]|nr:S-methyl-5'-thioadenosine phosphorylase [Planctomycetota bacterium]